MIDPALHDGFADALGQVLATERQEWRREREMSTTEHRRIVAELQAEVSSAKLKLYEMIAEKLASLQDGPPGPQGEPGERGEAAGDTVAPDSLVPLLGRALALLNEAPPIEAKAAPGITLNLTTPTSTHRKTITTRRDDEGNLIAEVVDVEG
jgi:hypothetical protein